MPVKTNFSVYAYMGQRIRERRKKLKISQAQLAEMMGFSYQQIQKYETGASQISVGKLLRLAKLLDVSPLYFYEGAKLDDTIGLAITSDIVPKSRTSPLQILLLETNPSDEAVFRKTIACCGERVEFYVLQDAAQMGDYLQNHESKYGTLAPDVVLLDLPPSQKSGIPLLRTLKSNAETMELPVIILSHSSSRKEMREAYRLGAAGYILKAVDPQQYAESLESAIRYWSRAVALPSM